MVASLIILAVSLVLLVYFLRFAALGKPPKRGYL
jgi:hypothetical protein